MATKKAARVKRSYQQWHVDPTPTIIDVIELPKDHPDRPRLLKAAGIKDADTFEQQLRSSAAERASNAQRGGAPIKMGGTVTRYPDPGGNPTLGIQADDVSVRVGGFPIRNPTAVSGNSVAPASAAVIADTGALPAGTYLVEVNLIASAVAAAGKQLQVEHRNAANAATVNVLGGVTGGQVFQAIIERVVLAINERIRVVVGAVAFAASEGAIASIRAYRLDV